MSLSPVAIVIPCYRVERHIASVIRSIPERFGMIICVDDASPDRTAAEIESLGDPRVTLLRRRVNGGVGAATKEGFTEAIRQGAGILVKMDGDGQMSADDLDDLIAPLREDSADYSKGNRMVDLTALARMPRLRLFGNAVLAMMTKAASGYWNVLDVTNGFFAVRTDLLRQMNWLWLSDGYFFEISLLIELNVLRGRLADVQMPPRYGDEQSSMRLWRIGVTFPWLLLRGGMRRFWWRYILADFGLTSVCLLTGVPLMLFGFCFGAWHWWKSIETGVPATAGTVFVSALPIIVGFQSFLAALLLDVASSPTAKRSSRPKPPSS